MEVEDKQDALNNPESVCSVTNDQKQTEVDTIEQQNKTIETILDSNSSESKVDIPIDVDVPIESEHDEESENDLQSVLNKISESLKTINQETMIPEDQTTENISEDINVTSISDIIITEPVKSIPEEQEKSIEKINDEEENVEKEKETHSEIIALNENLKLSETENIMNSEVSMNSEENKSPSKSEQLHISITGDSNKNDEQLSSEPSDGGKLEILNKTVEPMDILDEDNDVVAIEEPTTIINLDDDDEENDTETKIETEPTNMDIDIAEKQYNEIDENSSTNKTISDKVTELNNQNECTKSEESQSLKNLYNNKECINNDCKKNSNLFYKAPVFGLNFYKVTMKPNKTQFLCDDCYDLSIDKYEEWCNILENQQPLLLANIPKKKNEFVEILDSSDEEKEDVLELVSEKGDFSEDTVDLLNNELDNIICDVFGRVEIQNQLTWSKSILQHRLLKLEEDAQYITDTLTKLQKNADNMNNSLYQCPKIEMKVLAPLDLNSGKPFLLGEATLCNQFTIPPVGDIFRSKIELNTLYFGAKNKVMASWLPCKVVDFVDVPTNSQCGKASQLYKIKFMKIKIPILKVVPAKHMAYSDAPKVQLAIGTRVIALFDASTLSKDKDASEIKSAFYPGIIAEALQAYNNYRYLIFFDDGYTQYVNHREVRLICEASINVWEDIHPGSREFIQNYLINYKKNRPMVQVKKGQSMITELNGKWIYAKVIDVDASLINMLFEGQKNHTEWIYRGSTRLGPLFKATQKTNIPTVTRLPRRSEPYVRYMQDDDDIPQRETATKSTTITNEEYKPPVRAVAKKSTSRQETTQSAPVKHLNNSIIFVDDEEPKGKLVYYSSKISSNLPPRKFVLHECSPTCITRKITIGHNYGVLSKPLLNSWERSIYKLKGKKLAVTYTAPCGRRLRSMQEVHKYLRLTKNVLNVENFVFDPECGCLTEYQVQRCIVNTTDITEGQEKMPIQCVNYYDHTMPPECVYSAVRLPTEGVHINTNEDYLVGCDCEDDCSDKSKCSCWQLTIEGAKYGNPNTPIDNVGYFYKRLPDPVPTGIYECNSRCKCSKHCINRVVQHPLDTKLQVFKTSNRGWGLRCINDVPKGSFICIYAGELLTEQKANEGGAKSGDEYFAELDYIEVAERLKEGYESDVQEEIDSDEEDIPEKDSDEEFRPSTSNKNNFSNNRLQIKKTNNNGAAADDDDEQERQAINFEPNTSLANADEENSPTKYQSMRKLFGKNEYCYIMDAKNIGNVGRYFNHSCSPNLFVQNVFVDTHDLRFPWVAFFALSQIRAGTELTWNYNYEVGVVPGKVLYCQCGTPSCRGRLL